MVGFTHRVEFPQFEVLKFLQEGISISEIARARKVSRTAIYKVLSTLKKKAMISRRGYGVYELTSKGMQGLHSFVGLRYNLRQHNLHFKIKILESPRNWALKRNQLRQLPYFNKTLKLKNNEQDIFSYGKLQVKTTSRSVILKMPTIYAKNWEHAMIQAIQILEDSMIKIEHAFKIKLVKDYKANITVISQEYASLQDALAKLYRTEGNRVYLTGEDGKIWLITDFSFSTDELEFIHPDKATDDVDAIAPMLNDLRKHPTTFSDVRTHIGEIQNVMQGVLRNEVKHQGVLDDILIAFRDWKETNADLNKRLKKAGI